MLCSLCQHGVTARIGGKPTGATWDCPCGESHCRHIDRCQCGRSKRQKYKVGDTFRLLAGQSMDEGHGERKTPAGSLIVIFRIDPDTAPTPYIVKCYNNGAWWFFSQDELEREAELIDAIRPPEQGDYLGLGGELHTTIDASHGMKEAGTWLVEDNRGEDFRVVRDPDNDNDIRRAWRLAK